MTPCNLVSKIQRNPLHLSNTLMAEAAVSSEMRCQSSEQLLEFFGRDPNDFLSRLVTMDETWLYHYDPETKQQSMEWRHSGSPHPKKFRVQKSGGTVLASIFWDQDGILLIDYLPNGQTINVEYYSPLLVQLKDILKEKRRGKVTFQKAVIFTDTTIKTLSFITQFTFISLSLPKNSVHKYLLNIFSYIQCLISSIQQHPYSQSPLH